MNNAKPGTKKPAGIFGTLRDALAAASRDETAPPRAMIRVAETKAQLAASEPVSKRVTPVLPMQASAADAVRIAKTPVDRHRSGDGAGRAGRTPNRPPARSCCAARPK